MPARHFDDQLKTLRLLGILSLVIPLLVACLFGFYRFYESRQEARQQVDRSLRVAGEHASKVVVIAESLEDRVADAIRGRDASALKRDEAGLHASLAKLIGAQNQITAIWILGPDGAPIASSHVYPLTAVNMADRAYFKFHAAEPGQRNMSAPFVSRETGQRIVNFSFGLTGPDGKLAAVVNVGVSTGSFQRFYADLAADEPGLAVALFNSQGGIYARWPATEPAVESLPAEAPVLRSIATGQSMGELRGASTIDGHDRLMSYQQVVENYPLYVGAGMSTGALALALVKDFAVLLALGLPPFIALWMTVRAARRRVADAAEATRRLGLETASRRRAEDALVQSQKLEALGRVAGGVAHEFNNALMVVASNVHLLKKTAGDGAKRLDSISRAVDGATKLTRQLLSFTRRQPLAPKSVDLERALPAMAALLSPVLGGRVTLEIAVEPGVAHIVVDEAELELALVNLAINARDAMPDGGSFKINARLSEDGSRTLITATDSGSGISEQDLPRIFEPFFTTKPVGSGTGLGLAQVFGLCDRAGGSVVARSGPGRGTTFHMAFPAAGSEAAETRAIGLSRPVAGLSVLLVEDDDEVADAMLPLIEGFGCSVLRVDRADKALALLEGKSVPPPHIVVSDVRMPGPLDGLGLARHLRASQPKLPVLLITGYSEGIDEIERERFDVLAKPCSAQALQSAIAHLALAIQTPPIHSART